MFSSAKTISPDVLISLINEEAEVDEVPGEAEVESLALAPRNAGTVERKDILRTIALTQRKKPHRRRLQ